jgi:hypothetical protein
MRFVAANTDNLSIAVLDRCWEKAVGALFGNNPLYPEYYQSCLDRNFKEAEIFINNGAFAEHTYLWNTVGNHNDCMPGCQDDFKKTPIYWLLFDEKESKMVHDLFSLDLLDIECCPEKWHSFIRKCISES